MGAKADRLQALLESSWVAEDELLNENTALRRELREARDALAALEDVTVELLRGWQQTCVAADRLQAIRRKWDEYGFAIVEPGPTEAEFLQAFADIFGVPVSLIGDSDGSLQDWEDAYVEHEVEPIVRYVNTGTELDGHFSVTVVDPDFFDSLLQDDAGAVDGRVLSETLDLTDDVALAAYPLDMPEDRVRRVAGFDRDGVESDYSTLDADARRDGPDGCDCW